MLRLKALLLTLRLLRRRLFKAFEAEKVSSNLQSVVYMFELLAIKKVKSKLLKSFAVVFEK